MNPNKMDNLNVPQTVDSEDYCVKDAQMKEDEDEEAIDLFDEE